MANLDPRFFCTSDIDSYFVDNASGLPLSGGIVTFYSDVNRISLKPVYQLTGTPGNYTYSALPNPLPLSSAGTYTDEVGNNIVIYYYPFTGTPDDDTGVQELYYITCVNSGFVPQFIRQGWPQAAGSNTPPIVDEEIDNFIPNGQFLAHNNISSLTEPPITALTFGAQTIDAQAIAQGGWYFAYTNGTNATFSNTFAQIPSSGGWGINSFPKYLFTFNCTSIGGTPPTRDLWITWPDINKFSSGNPPGSIPYTLFFDARSNDGNSYTFTLYQIYYFGTGGSPSTSFFSSPIATINIGPSSTLVSQNIQNITWLVNQGTIGTNGDDFVGLALRGPASGWNVSMSDFVLAQGNETFLSFPVETNDQMLSRGVAGFMPTPNPDGSDLYLPLILTPQGMIFDHSEISTIVAKPLANGLNNELLCDGNNYLCGGYSSIGIPYKRLFNMLYDTSNNLAEFGSGASFIQSYINSGLTSQIYLTTNQAGAVTHPAVGAGLGSFTFRSGTNGAATVNYTAYANADNFVTVFSNFTNGTHSGNLFADNNTTMSFTSLNTPLGGEYYKVLIGTVTASTLANTGMAGKYFTFSNHATDYYFWFYVTNETDPAPGGTGIQCDIDTNMSAADVAIAIATRLGEAQIDFITCSAASSIAAGDYFTFYANSPSPQEYVLWYQINGVGTQPVVSGTPIYLLTNIGSADSAATVADKTQNALNTYLFATPDLRGMFLRGNDPTGIWDLDVAKRYSFLGAILGTNPGTFELDQLISHDHSIANITNIIGPGGTGAVYTTGPAGTLTSPVTNFTGGTENRPVNMSVNWFIKY